MSYGTIEYNEDGKPKCEICGKHFDRIATHVRQKHNMNEREYKIKFGLDLSKGICSKESSERTRVKTLDNYEKCIQSNLISNGQESRFKKGDAGRTKDKVSEQTRKRLKENLKNPKMLNAMKENGKTVGSTGLGNKTRWGKK